MQPATPRRGGKDTGAGAVGRIDLLAVRHESRVAAVRTAAGPTALLEAGLAEELGASGVRVRVLEIGDPPADVLGEVARSFAVSAMVAEEVRRSLRSSGLPIVLSPSCHSAVGSVSGLPKDARGVLWLDAHGDLHTPETSPSGLLDGMTLATITGRGWRCLRESVPGFAPVPDEAVLMVGARDLDRGEARTLERSGVTRLGVGEVPDGCADAFRRLLRRVESVSVHLDLDVVDSRVGRANDFASPGGLDAEVLELVLAMAARTLPVRALTLASYDPRSDLDGAVAKIAVRAVVAWARIVLDDD